MGQDNGGHEGPDDVKLFLNSQGPQMQQGIAPDVRIEVSFFVEENLDVCAENQGCIHGVERNIRLVDFAEAPDYEKCKAQDQGEGGINSFDSATVEIDV